MKIWRASTIATVSLLFLLAGRSPHGIVALEGIACGCVPIGTAEGGLPEAIGPCGRSFQTKTSKHWLTKSSRR